MLERFALAAAFDEVAHDGSLNVGQRIVKVRVELNPRTAARVSQKDFGIQPRGLAAGLLQMRNRPIQNPPDRPDVVRRSRSIDGVGAHTAVFRRVERFFGRENSESEQIATYERVRSCRFSSSARRASSSSGKTVNTSWESTDVDSSS